MRKLLLTAVAALLLPTAAFANPVIDKPAPTFSVKDINNKAVDLAALKGKIVVLEWTNPTCPFVEKHYDGSNMQKLQAEATKKDVVWLTINSSAEGKHGAIDAKAAKAYLKDKKLASTHYILDPEGKLGKLYAAKTTPHMFVIDKKGNLAYMGAIDSDSNINPESIKKATNYVSEAITALASDKPVKTKSTQSYGCGVKYAD